MDHVAAGKKSKGDQVAPPRPSVTAEAAVMKKKPTTLLDAFEVECIRRELEKLVAKQSNNRTGAVGKGAGATAAPDNAHGHHHRHHGIGSKTTITTTTSARRKVEVSPSTAAKGARRGGRVRLPGRHAVAICRGAAPVSGGHVIAGGIRRRGGYREVEKV